MDDKHLLDCLEEIVKILGDMGLDLDTLKGGELRVPGPTYIEKVRKLRMRLSSLKKASIEGH